MSDAKKIFIIAGEHSGDILGGKVMQALQELSPYALSFAGVGGEHMEAQGLASLFPMSDVAVMGPIDIAKALPRIVRRVYQCVDAALVFQPDLVLIIDSPEFTHPIAKRIKKKLPDCPVIDYVSPTVWAWRPGRAKKMKAYVDHVLALLPFEPAAHERLGGAKCTYVGHPMIEKLEWIRTRDAETLAHRLNIKPDRPVLVVLPGSRPNEVKRLMKPFGETIEAISKKFSGLEVIIPVVPSVQHLIESELQSWAHPVHLVFGEEDKFASFRLAKAALAASGTVTLELALAETPMVVGYKADMVMVLFKGLIQVPSIILANLILEKNVFPEFIQDECHVENLEKALLSLITETPERHIQMSELSHIEQKMVLRDTEGKQVSPSKAAAEIVLEYLTKGHQITSSAAA